MTRADTRAASRSSRTPGGELLTEANRVGLALSREPDDTLRIRGPRAAGPIARQLLARKNDVLATVGVYNGQVVRLDSCEGAILEQPRLCVLCGRQTLLIEPHDGRPCHKTCAEDAIGQRAATAPRNSQPADGSVEAPCPGYVTGSPGRRAGRGRATRAAETAVVILEPADTAGPAAGPGPAERATASP